MQSNLSNTLRTISIPTQLCNHVIKNDLWRPMQVMLVLKSEFWDKTRLCAADLQNIADSLGITTKTVRNNLKKLINENWIGYNPKSKCYHIRSLWKIKVDGKFKSLDCAQFDYRSILDIKAHVVAQSIGKLLNYQKKKLRTEHRKSAERKKHPFQTTDLQDNGYYPLANKALAKCWGKSKSHAHKMKRLAQSCNFIHVQVSVNSEVSKWYYYMCRIGRKDEANYTMKINGDTTCFSDLVQHKLHFKTHRTRLKKHK